MNKYKIKYNEETKERNERNKIHNECMRKMFNK